MVFKSIVILLFLFLSFCDISKCAIVSNNKPIWTQKIYYNSPTRLNDGDGYSCDWMREHLEYFILDLENKYDISQVSMHGYSSLMTNKFDLVVSDHFVPCEESDILNWQSCDATEELFNSHITFKPTKECKGRFIALRFKRYVGSLSWVKICEIQVESNTAPMPAPAMKYFKPCQQLSSEENIVKTASIAAPYFRDRINDQILDQSDVYNKCFYDIKSTEVRVKLDSEYKVNFVRIWNSKSGGNEYRTEVTLCNVVSGHCEAMANKSTSVTFGDSITIYLDQPQIIDTIIIKATTESERAYFYICEVEATGIKVTTLDLSLPVSSFTAADFPISSTLRSGATKGVIPSGSHSVWFAGDNCEPIISYNDFKRNFLVACKANLGRVLIYGRTYSKSEILNIHNYDETLKSNIIKWLQYDNNNNGGNVYNLHDWRQAQKGDIVLAGYAANTILNTNDKIEFLNVLRAGNTFSVVVATSIWTEHYYTIARNSYQFILDEVKADIGDSIEYNQNEVTFSDSDYSKMYPGLKKAWSKAASSPAFMAQYSNILQSSQDGRGLDAGRRWWKNDPDTFNQVKNDILKVLEDGKQYVKKNCPTLKNPIGNLLSKQYIGAYTAAMRSQLLIDTGFKAPCAHIFPGDISDSAERESITVTAQAKNDFEYHSTGFYLAPGDTLRYTIISNTQSSVAFWKLNIGCQKSDLTRHLSGSNILQRYPIVSSSSEILDLDFSETSGTLYSPFGGAVWLQNIRTVSSGSLKIRIDNIVRSPIVNLRIPENEGRQLWEQTKSSQIRSVGPIVEIIGHHFIVCAIDIDGEYKQRSYDYYKNLWEKYWDASVMNNYRMRHLDSSSRSAERFSVDTQIEAGYALSGYPIQGGITWNEYVLSNYLDPWGVLHEIGHRFVDLYWRLGEAGEIEVNIFPLLNLKQNWNIDTYNNSIRITEAENLENFKQILTVSNEPTNPSVWASNLNFGLCIFAQIAHHLGFGTIQEVQRIGNENRFTWYAYDRVKKHDAWIETISKTVGVDIRPLALFWGFEISSDLNTAMNAMNMPCFMPNDVLTDLAPQKRSNIVKLFGRNCLTVSPKKIPFNNGDGSIVPRVNTAEVTLN